MIKIVHSDITNAKRGFILHGVNCMGHMGAGVALAIKNRWPEVFEEYRLMCQKNEGEINELLGGIQRVQVKSNSDLCVINCFTQLRWGKTARASYDAIESCMDKVVSMMYLGEEVHFPAIGCGYGKLQWSVVERIIDNCIPDTYPKTLWMP